MNVSENGTPRKQDEFAIVNYESVYNEKFYQRTVEVRSPSFYYIGRSKVLNKCSSKNLFKSSTNTPNVNTEPMEIDTSGDYDNISANNSLEKNSLLPNKDHIESEDFTDSVACQSTIKSCSENNIPTKNRIRPLIKRKDVPKEKRNEMKTKYVVYVIFSLCLIAFMIVSSLIIFQYNVNMHIAPCNQNLESTPIVRNLKLNLYGQDHVISNVESFIENLQDKNILVFFGDSGVGKTYTSSIISNNFPWKNNYHILVSPIHTTIEHELKLLKLLSYCGYNLIIVDDLRSSDIYDTLPFVRSLCETDKKIITILIFNIHSHWTEPSSDYTVRNIENIFNNENLAASTQFIVFNDLSHEIIIKCIQKAMVKRGIELKQKYVETVFKDIEADRAGCKRVDSKVAILNIEN